MARSTTVHVVIQNGEEGVVWEGEARTVSSVNSQGPFDILPRHANFITIIRDQPLRITTNDGTEQTFQIEQAVIFTKENAVNVYRVGRGGEQS